MCILLLLIVQIYFGGTELIWTVSASPYPGRLGKLPNVLCCLLSVATQQVCKFSSAGCWRAVEIYLKTIESGYQLGNCFIGDITIEDCVRAQCRKLIIVAYQLSNRTISEFFR